MPNIIIPLHHQSAPELKFDRVLAEEAAAVRNPRAAKRDWDLVEWETANPVLARRRRMRNQNFDDELDRPAHHDPDIQLLEQRAYIDLIERRPEQWVEENLELYEENCSKAKAQYLPAQERFKEEKERLVNILHPSQVMRKLRQAGVDARDQESPHARIWLNEWTRDGLVGVNVWVRPEPMDDEAYLLMLKDARSQAQRDLITQNFWACRAGRKVARTITSLQEPYGPEWSLMHYNDHGVATRERYRGWRTAMLVLIVADILTEEEVDRAFGPPIGEAASFYRQQLQAFRQIKLGRAV